MVEDDPDHAFLVRRTLREQLLETSTWCTPTSRRRPSCSRTATCGASCWTSRCPTRTGLDGAHGSAPCRPVACRSWCSPGTDSDELGREPSSSGAQDYLVKGQHGPDALGRSVVFALERTKRQAAEQRQTQLADRLQLVLEASAEGICMLDEPAG